MPLASLKSVYVLLSALGTEILSNMYIWTVQK